MEVEEEMLVEPTVIEAAAQAAFQDDSEPMDSGDDMATRPSYPALSAAQMAVSGRLDGREPPGQSCGASK